MSIFLCCRGRFALRARPGPEVPRDMLIPSSHRWAQAIGPGDMLILGAHEWVSGDYVHGPAWAEGMSTGGCAHSNAGSLAALSRGMGGKRPRVAFSFPGLRVSRG